jgi:hypothetical protein
VRTVTLQLARSRYVSSDSTLRHASARQCWQPRGSAKDWATGSRGICWAMTAPGAPQGFELSIAEGIVSSKRTIDGERFVQTSAPISKGSSGGGLFDAQGNLLGITTKIRKDAQNLNFAIAAEEYAK